jgi:type IV pilus assembly protein PilV
MSGCIIAAGALRARVSGLGMARKNHFAVPPRGIGMLEFLIALLIFSTGMAGLLSVQLAGKKAAHKAAQRLVATHLGRDILERIQANPGEIAAYRVTSAGDSAGRLPGPEIDCSHAACGTEQLAVFDLWQWESALLGESEQYSDGSAPGLVSPRACITSEGGYVTVSISWLDITAVALPVGTVCGADGEVGTETAEEVEENLRRRQLTLSTFVAAR